MKKQDNPFAAIMDGILAGVSKDTQSEYSKEIDILKGIKDAEDYSMYVSYPLGNCLDEAIRLKLTPNAQPQAIHKVAFLYSNYHYVEHHLEYFIVQREGMACSADKSRYIIRAYEKYFLEGTPLALPYSEEDKKNKCFWKPHFWDDKIWLDLFEALVSLHYGKAQQYLIFMKDNFVVKK